MMSSRSSLYFEISPPENKGLARPIDADAGRELRDNLYRRGILPPDALTEVQYDARDCGFLDFLPTVDISRVVSERLRDVLAAAQPEGIQWVPCLATSGNDSRRYWSPHFIDHPDAYLESQTTRDKKGRVIKWVLDRTRLAGFNVFIIEQLTDGIIVTADVARECERSGLTGVTAVRARVL